jgi:energy-coupling factor transporter transmembrane protein EcfT
MCARGFDGAIRRGRSTAFGRADWAFLLGWCALFVVLRTHDVAQWLGASALGVLP